MCGTYRSGGVTPVELLAPARLGRVRRPGGAGQSQCVAWEMSEARIEVEQLERLAFLVMAYLNDGSVIVIVAESDFALTFSGTLEPLQK